MAKEFLHIFKVRPSTEGIHAKFAFNLCFPVDMLRRDACWPRTEQDAVEIGSTISDLSIEDIDEIHDIELCHIDRKNWKPTADRWKSFGWEVIDHEVGRPL